MKRLALILSTGLAIGTVGCGSSDGASNNDASPIAVADGSADGLSTSNDSQSADAATQADGGVADVVANDGGVADLATGDTATADSSVDTAVATASGTVTVTGFTIKGIAKPDFTCVMNGSTFSYLAGLHLVTIACNNGAPGFDIIQVRLQLTDPKVGSTTGGEVSATVGTTSLPSSTGMHTIDITSWSDATMHIVGTAQGSWTDAGGSGFKMAFDATLGK